MYWLTLAVLVFCYATYEYISTTRYGSKRIIDCFIDCVNLPLTAIGFKWKLKRKEEKVEVRS